MKFVDFDNITNDDKKLRNIFNDNAVANKQEMNKIVINGLEYQYEVSRV